MRILCVIDHFGSGGAQRQMTALASGLKARGHAVEMFIYYPEYDFFRGEIERWNIPVHQALKAGGSSFRVLKSLIDLLRRERYDAIIAFLDSPSVYAELARIGSRGFKLIVSERSSRLSEGPGPAPVVRRLLHALADHVVANSHSQARWLRGFPWLKKRVAVIYNGLQPCEPAVLVPPAEPSELRLVAIGRVGPEKNVLNLLRGLVLLHSRLGWLPSVSWVGRRDESVAGQRYCQEVEALLDAHPLVKARWEWLGERADVTDLLSRHHALIHPSLYEGLPNVICEALAVGRPVLASNVCDHPLLVECGERGRLFDPADPAAIAGAVESLGRMDAAEWQRLSENASRYARQHLSLDRMISEYEALL